ncbi:hypothetical protein GCM10011584_13150 [Nocardioides phosphati]|uniref:DUF2306 domain-containing protein n=1 Tax=Nocardioides phosphati TaxID=1867775 RepID=A0ABQ2N8K6_9ACTN|nr:DUF2306 domain-containing protein [Nocardioides phosphati]GGO87758.1 hypothetical protein GCM10011584_13150 [Nocardioides phosphati]
MRTPRLATLGWITAATIVLLYVPMAAEYTARLFGGGPELWDHAYAATVGERHALGAGSIHEVQAQNYQHHRVVLLLHTLLASVAITLSVFQLTRRSRRRLAVHRWVGRLQVMLVAVSMTAGLTFLGLVGPDGTFDGPAFFIQLVALASGTLLATLLGWAAIRGRQVASHRVLMTYAFALLCTAPFLRLGYLLLGLAWPDQTQEVTNLAGGAIEAVWAPMAALLAARLVPAARRRDHLRPLPRSVSWAPLLLGTIGLAGLAVAYGAAFDGIDRVTLTAAAANALGLLLTGMNLRAANDPTAREDWTIHHAAMLLAAPATAALWLAYRLPFTTGQAYYGALLTGPAVTLSLGLVLVAWRRRSPARRTAPEPATA